MVGSAALDTYPDGQSLLSSPTHANAYDRQLCWGSVTIGVAFIKGRGALIATRLLIGLFEAGFYPTSVAYLSTFYRRFDLAVRIGLFYGQYAVAGAFSGALCEFYPCYTGSWHRIGKYPYSRVGY